MIQVHSFRPRASGVKAVQNSGKAADMYSIAAWVLDNGGQVFIKDNYEFQGPDQLHVMARNAGGDTDPIDQLVRVGWWIVLLSHSNFKIIANDKFQETYQVIEERERG